MPTVESPSLSRPLTTPVVKTGAAPYQVQTVFSGLLAIAARQPEYAARLGMLSLNIENVPGQCSEATLRGALLLLTERHEAMRTTHALDAGRVIQQVRAAPSLESLPVYEDSAQPPDLPDPGRDVPWVAIYRSNPDAGTTDVTLWLSHLVSDGHSLAILKRELRALLAGQGLGPAVLQPLDLPDPRPMNEASRAHWDWVFQCPKLSVFDVRTDLVDAPYACSVSWEHPPAEADKRGLATPGTVALAAYGAAIAHVSGEEDFLVDVYFARPYGGLHTVGPLTRRMPMRIRPRKSGTVQELQADVRDNVMRTVRAGRVGEAALYARGASHEERHGPSLLSRQVFNHVPWNVRMLAPEHPVIARQDSLVAPERATMELRIGSGGGRWQAVLHAHPGCLPSEAAFELVRALRTLALAPPTASVAAILARPVTRSRMETAE